MIIQQFMNRINIGNSTCLIQAMPNPEAMLIQLTARHEQKFMADEMAAIEQLTPCGVVFAAVELDDWTRCLMPWADEAVSRDAEVGIHAYDTLSLITGQVIPWLQEHYGPLPCIIGGYSLGGLFSLWAASISPDFIGVAAASPSVWIRDWDRFADDHPIKARQVYTSLGDREEFVRNRRMAAVGDCMRRQHQRLLARPGKEYTTHEWSKGGHFDNEATRMAQAFLWNIRQLDSYQKIDKMGKKQV